MNRVLVERDVPCPMRDGVVLATDVFRPDDGERHPVLLTRTPYDKTFLVAQGLDPIKMALRGYVLCVQDVRGRFASEGDHLPYLNESQDGHDAVQWAAAQPWSDGTVGMYGVSYMAQTQFQAASTRPPALRAIAPVESPSGSTGGDRHRGGALALGTVASWSSGVALPELVRRMRVRPELRAHFPRMIEEIDNLDVHMRNVPLLPFSPMEHELGMMTELFNQTVRGEYTRPLPRFDHADIAVPALVIAGWYDVFLQPDLDHFNALRERAATEEARTLTRLMVLPWSHGRAESAVGELDFGMRSSPYFLDLREDLNELHRRWFDARLRGIPTGIDEEARVRVFVMGSNRWRDFDSWPPPGTVSQSWYLVPAYRGSNPPMDSLLTNTAGLGPTAPTSGEEDASTYWLDPENPVITRGGGLLMPNSYIKGPVVQLPTEARDDVLVFTSEPLTNPLEVIGRVRLVAWVSTETADSDVVARLCDVHPDGRSYNVMDGILRLTARDGVEHPAKMPLGEAVRVEVDLWSTAHVFLPGHRLRLQVCASDFPRYDRCPGSGPNSAEATRILPQRNRLFHDAGRPSHLELPVITA